MRQPTPASLHVVSASILLACCSASANAQPEVNGLYQDLQADFLALPALLSVSAASNANHSSFGQVQRLIPTLGTASFASGFTSGFDPADFTTTFSVTNITSTSASMLLLAIAMFSQNPLPTARASLISKEPAGMCWDQISQKAQR